jgi:hypothetical protein
MPVPSVQANSAHANSVQACNAGNVNGRLNVTIESRAGLVVCLALPRGTFRGTFVAVPMAVDLCSTLTLWNMLIYWDSLLMIIVHTYSQLYFLDGFSLMTIIRFKRNPLT